MGERKSFLLRIDPALWTELESWAQDDFRSVNAQIEFLLNQAVNKRKGARSRAPVKSPDTSPPGADPNR
jgi:hypothetical protein